MKTDQINGMDEIIFEKRNKHYGAYELRRKYAKRLIRSFLISVTLFFTIFLLPAIKRVEKRQEMFSVRDDSVKFTDIIYDDFKNYELRQRVKSVRPDENIFLPLKDSLIDNKTVENDTSENIEDAGTENVNSEGVGQGAADTTEAFGLTADNEPRTLAQVDKMPEFPGGLEKFYSYLVNRIHYTHSAKEAQVNGKLYVRFIIDEHGLVTDVTLINSIGYGLDEQVRSVIGDSPGWKPGIYRENAVKTVMVLPVSFNIK